MNDYDVESQTMKRIWEEQKQKEEQEKVENPLEGMYYEKCRQGIMKYQKENPEKHLLQKAEQLAKRKNIEFRIGVEDIKIPKFCPYLGFELTTIRGERKVDTNTTLSRIDSTKGFVPGNVEVISVLANSMKQEATPEEIRTFCENMLRFYSK